VKAKERGQAEAIDASNDHRITKICLKPTRRIDKDFGAGGAGRRNGQGRTLQLKNSPNEICGSEGVLSFSIVKISG
jgi:hypothetical protein